MTLNRLFTLRVLLVSAAALTLFASAPSAQVVRQTSLYIDNGSGHFTNLESLGTGIISFPSDTGTVALLSDIASSLSGAVILAPGTVGRNTITPTSDIVPLLITDFSGGTSDILDLQDGSGNPVASFSPGTNGLTLGGTTGTMQGILRLYNATGNKVFTMSPTGTIVKLNTSFTAEGNLTTGKNTLAGALLITDGASNTATINAPNAANDPVFNLPAESGAGPYTLLVSGGGGFVQFDVATAQTSTDHNYAFILNDAPTSAAAEGGLLNSTGGTSAGDSATGLTLNAVSGGGDITTGLYVSATGGNHENRAIVANGQIDITSADEDISGDSWNVNHTGAFSAASYSAAGTPGFSGDGSGLSGLTSGQITNFTSAVQGTSYVGGDLSGTVGDASLAAIDGTTLTITSLTAKDVLYYNGSAWVNQQLASSDLSDVGSLATTTDVSNAITTAEGFATTAANNALTTAEGYATTAANNAQANAEAASVLLAPTAAQTITPATDFVPLTIEDASGGTKDILDIEDGSGNSVASFSPGLNGITLGNSSGGTKQGILRLYNAAGSAVYNIAPTGTVVEVNTSFEADGSIQAGRGSIAGSLKISDGTAGPNYATLNDPNATNDPTFNLPAEADAGPYTLATTGDNTDFVNSINNAAFDTTLTFAGTGSGPYTGAVTGKLNLDNANTWTNEVTIAPGSSHDVTSLLVEQTATASPSNAIMDVTNTGASTHYLTVDPNGNIGIGMATPSSQFSNFSTGTNIVDPYGTGGVNKTFTWVSNSGGYAATVDNSTAADMEDNGLLVKVANNRNASLALEVSSGDVGPAGTTLFDVWGNGNVTMSPSNADTISIGNNTLNTLTTITGGTAWSISDVGVGTFGQLLAGSGANGSDQLEVAGQATITTGGTAPYALLINNTSSAAGAEDISGNHWSILENGGASFGGGIAAASGGAGPTANTVYFYGGTLNTSGSLQSNATSNGPDIWTLPDSTGTIALLSNVTGAEAAEVILLPTASSRNVIQPSVGTAIPLTVEAHSGQSVDLQDWDNSTGTPIASIDASGDASFVRLTSSGSSTIATSGSTINTFASGGFSMNSFGSGGSAMNSFGDGGFAWNTFGTGGSAMNTIGSDGTSMTTILGGRSVGINNSSSSAGATDIADGSGSTGSVSIGNTTGGVTITSTNWSASGAALTAGGTATAGSLALTDGTGGKTYTLKATTGGSFSPTFLLPTEPGPDPYTLATTADIAAITGNYVQTAPTAAQSITAATDFIPLTIVGSAGQTTDLQDWSNSTPTVLASIDASGDASFAGLSSSGNSTIATGASTVNSFGNGGSAQNSIGNGGSTQNSIGNGGSAVNYIGRGGSATNYIGGGGSESTVIGANITSNTNIYGSVGINDSSNSSSDVNIENNGATGAVNIGNATGGVSITAATTITTSTGNPVALTITNTGTGEDVSAQNWTVTQPGAATFNGGITVGSGGATNAPNTIQFNNGGQGTLVSADLGSAPDQTWTLPAASGTIALQGHTDAATTDATASPDFTTATTSLLVSTYVGPPYAVTMTIPAATSGTTLTILWDKGDSSLTITPASGQILKGTSFVAPPNTQGATLVGYGTNWYVVGIY